MRVTISPHLDPHLFLSSFFITILAGIKWHLVVVLIDISLMTNGVEHFTGLLAFGYLFQRNVYSNSLPTFTWIIYLFIPV